MEGKSEPTVCNDEFFALSSTPVKFYRLPLPLDRIFLVDNARSLRECMRVLCAVCFELFIKRCRMVKSSLAETLVQNPNPKTRCPNKFSLLTVRPAVQQE